MPIQDNTVKKITEVAESKVSKIRHSTYFITVNSNKRRYDTKAIDEFKEVMSVLFKDGGEGIMPYIEESKKVVDPNYLSKIEDITIDGAFENLTQEGTDITKFHLHVTVDIAHRTYLSFNYNALKQDIQKVLPGVYFNVKYIDRAIVSVEDYIHKYDKFGEKLGLEKISIDPNAPTFHDFLRSRGITPSTAKSNMTAKMEKSILGQLLDRDGIDKKAMVFKIAAKNGLITKSLDEALDLIASLDKRVTDDELMVFLEL